MLTIDQLTVISNDKLATGVRELIDALTPVLLTNTAALTTDVQAALDQAGEALTEYDEVFG